MWPKFISKSCIRIPYLLIIVFVGFVYYNLWPSNTEPKIQPTPPIVVFPKIQANTNITFNNNITSTPSCSATPPGLIGRFDINLDIYNEAEIEDLLLEQGIEYGGKWKPKNCTARHHIAIMIPFRDRKIHLLQFLLNMHPLLARQELSYGIYLIEPVENITFNRGILFNIGFIEANKDTNYSWKCHALHDVDLISEDDRTLYICPENPAHLSYRISKFNYKPIYQGNFGGVSVMKKEQYEKINGFSNLYFGWGGEDDDFATRVIHNGYKIDKPKEGELGRYYMHKHSPDKPNPERIKLLKNASKRSKIEGLNNVDYKLISVVKRPLYTKFIVSYNQTAILNDAVNRNLTKL